MALARWPLAPTSFVGRSDELKRVSALLADPACRLLTLVGPGGIGKTRLALQAGADQAAQFAHGVHFVSLTPVSAPALIPDAIANALQIPLYNAEDPARLLIHHLSEKRMLLVMDNFEHLVDGVDLLTAILQAAEGVKFLVTSRVLLNVQEEWVFPLDGLRVPENGTTDSLTDYSAIQLFVQRARQAQPTFSLSDHSDAVKTICRRVEGMPLGLELAASWLRSMTCEQIAGHMERSLQFLTTSLRNVPERHRSLQTVFEQSWQLLSAPEQNALMRLSVFQSSFDLDAAEQVAGAPLSLLADLVSKSLLRLHPSGRYDLHELVRQFAADKLAESGASRAAAQQHLAYALSLAEHAERNVWGQEQITWYDRLDLELDNLRAALTWAAENGEAETGLKLAAALGWFFAERSHLREGLTWIERLLTLTPEAPALLRAKALIRATESAGVLDDGTRCVRFSRQALQLARALGDRWTLAWALANRGYYIEHYRHPERAVPLLDESITLFRDIQDAMGLNHALRRRALLALTLHDYAYAQALFNEASRGAYEVNDQNAIAQCLNHQADLIWLRDRNLEQAIQVYEASSALFLKLGNELQAAGVLRTRADAEARAGNEDRAEALRQAALRTIRDIAPDGGHVELALVGLAESARVRGDYRRAARLLGAVRESTLHFFETHYTEADLSRLNIDEIRTRLGESAYRAAQAEGRAMTRQQVIGYGLERSTTVANAPVAAPTVASQSDPLNERELEVLQLVAEGYSNREIAERLVLAVGTIKWYLNEINSKLGVGSRTQAVARARDLGLMR